MTAGAGAAAAQEASDTGPRLDIDQSELSAHSGSTDLENPYGVPEPYRLAPIGGNTVQIELEPEILIANPNTPTTARDPVNITGIAQMVIDNGGGSVGLCTGSLINPRTVLFAAHCVNSRAQTAYGAGQGGVGIGFGFETNTRANAAGEVDELVRWLLGTGPTQAGRFQTNIQQAFYNVSQVKYNQVSLEPGNGFLYADIAVATLDTPAANIPTWALLFSPLTNTGPIGAAGTGFNVGIVGYGNNGTGTSGPPVGNNSNIDFRRRAAENVLGALTDLQTFEQFLFGGAPNGLTQNVYFIDFDDPRRGTGVAPSIFDFNAFRDNARPGVNGGASREGITSGGDSGGPLILQNFTQQFVIGVLSGGYTRFFSGQPANGFGTVAFYQPLYLYWDWIAANNPYRYVASVAGDANWTDASHWVTTLDPAYYVAGANGGAPVNGIPTDLGQGKNGTTGDFGSICFQQGGVSECLDTRTNIVTVENRPIGTGDAGALGDNSGEALIVSDRTVFDAIVREAQAEGGATTQALPAATLANGLPGATGFVPNNVDPVRTTGAMGRYFDVALIANGTTTLNTAVTIDRLTFGGNGATLAVAAAGSLNSLININHFAGTLAVNGTVSSVGDYSFFGGLISGSGRVNAPFLTSVTGQFAPGTTTTIGTLTVGGNLVLSSGSTYFVNLGANGFSDQIAVVANGTSTGAASVGGVVGFSGVAGATVRAGNLYTILTAAGGRTGTFANAAAMSAILRPTFVYTANAVQVRIDAASYASVVNPNSAVQRSYAALLDRDRGSANLLGLYDVLDMQNAATIQSTLEALAPRTQTLVSSIGTVVLDNNSRLIRERVSGLQPGNLGGTLAYYGRPIQMASVAASNMNGMMLNEMSDTMVQTDAVEGQLPENMSGFFAGGYLTGESLPMATALPFAGNDDFDGFYVAAGVEREVGTNGVIGLALSYTSVDGTTSAGGGSVDGNLYTGTLYTKQVWGSFYADSQITAGLYESDSTRPGNLPGQPFTLRNSQNSLAIAAEAGVGAWFGQGFRIGPRAALRSTYLGFDRSIETGGPTALVYDRTEFTSVQGRASVLAEGSGRFRPHLNATYVHDFNDHPTAFGANFVGAAPGLINAGFALASQDQDWFEVGGGFTFSAGNVAISLSADTTLDRDDVENQSYRASVAWRF